MLNSEFDDFEMLLLVLLKGIGNFVIEETDTL
jgi:hypothetical protein